jgi:uncharacterized membrane protein
MSRAVAAGIVVLIVASIAAAPAVAQSDRQGLQTPDRFDTTTFRVTVYGNGSATWVIEHRQPLANDSEVNQFEAYADAFEANESALYTGFVADAELLTRIGTNETGREMTARNFGRSASVDPGQSQGTVRMSFLWTNLARTDDERVVLSDVFDGGFYIGNGQTIVVERGPGLAFDTVRPTPDSRSVPDSLATSESVSWVGERSFNDSRPYAVLAPPSTVDTDTAGTGTPPAESGDGSFGPMALAAVVVIALAGAVAWRSGAVAAVLDDDEDDGGAATETPQASPEPTIEDEELLSDTDRVIKLLEDNGGRMKQADIVDSTEWSKSKVSMLLSDMESDGDISKLRVGRENIISLVGEEPDAAGSPFDEE